MTAGALLHSVHVRVPGKINVFLKVGTLLDDGYHEVASAYQAVSLYEDVRASPARDFSVRFTGPVDCGGLPADASNLAIQAASLLARRKHYRGGVRLEIEKRLPLAGGMGGASADAAGTLVACDELWGTKCTKEELLELASELGSDVPFALVGGTAIGTGRGDRLSPALAKGQFHWVLALSESGSSTPEVYAELDRHRERHADDIYPAVSAPSVNADVLQALRAGEPQMLAESLYNDLQAPALHLEPSISRVIELGEANGALAGLVSGAGPTVAFLASDVDHALELQIALSAARLSVVRAVGPVHGARIIAD